MRTLRTIADARSHLAAVRRAGRSVGLVPTMGAFHAGHEALIRAAREACDEVIVSLFVNPAQFEEAADLAAYPRTEAGDAVRAAELGVDVLFTPSVQEIYPGGFATTIRVAGLADVLEGAERGPGHFDAVCTVVCKLFNIVAPDVAYFGQKDAQQVVVVRRMVRDLDIPVRLHVVPTVREADGLAHSSRNARLDKAERERAIALSRGLEAVRDAVEHGERGRIALEAAGRAAMAAEDVRPEYLAVVDPETLAGVDAAGGRVLVVVAARIGPARLIDNVLIDTEQVATRAHALDGSAVVGSAERASTTQRSTAMSTPPRTDRPDGQPRRPVTLTKLGEMRALGEPIVMVTAYDHPSARVAEAAGIDIVLVGDSAANNVLGYSNTLPVTVDELLLLAAAVRRGLHTPLLVGDLPFGSYEASDEQAIATAHRFVKEAGCDAVKVEGSAERAHAIVRAGVPVMGHVGLTPQTATALGGYRAQGRTAERARAVLDEALELQEAGCFAIVFEAIPADVTDVIMAQIEVPIIGIGAGASTDGQVLVLHDLLGIHGDFQPKFVKRYADVRGEMMRGLETYAEEVRTRAFPGPEHTYGIAPEELARLKEQLRDRQRA